MLLEHIEFSVYDLALDAKYTACIIEQYYDNVLDASRTAVDDCILSTGNNGSQTKWMDRTLC